MAWLGLASAVSAGCDSDGNNKSPLRENIESTIGEPQEGTGVLGGNTAPLVAREAGAPRDARAGSGESDAGVDAGSE